MQGGGRLRGGYASHLHVSIIFHSGPREWSLSLEMLPASRGSAIGGNMTYRGERSKSEAEP